MNIQFRSGRIYVPPKANAVRLRRFWASSAPLPPASFDVDAAVLALTGIAIPQEMDDNNALSCCVLASQAKFMRRYHALEVGLLINVTDQQVKDAYFAQTGGPDDGLVPDDSFAFWASNGWAAGDDGAIHKIIGSARIDATDAVDVQRSIWKLGGCHVGGMIPEAWINQTTPWVPLPSAPIAGGHEMYAFAYDANGIWVETWDRKQLITWPAVSWCFSESNQGEAAGIVRGVDAANPIDGLDTAALMAELNQDKEAA